jgi:hypothetical protein
MAAIRGHLTAVFQALHEVDRVGFAGNPQVRRTGRSKALAVIAYLGR